MSRIGAWVRSARLASQSYLALPLLLGLALAHRAGIALDLWTAGLVLAFGVLDQLYIVWANDYADQETDRLNQTATIFSGGSRVLVEGKLAPRDVLRAAQIAAVLALLDGVVLGLRAGAPWPPLAALLALALLWLYSYPPVRLSYRGGGELLQALGVGLVLPVLAFTAAGGALAQLDVALIATLVPGQLACAIATTLPDEPSDRMSNKRTLSVSLGVPVAAAVASVLAALTALLLATSDRIPASTAGVFAAILAVQATLHRARPGTTALWLRVFSLLLAVLGLEAIVVIMCFSGAEG